MRVYARARRARVRYFWESHAFIIAFIVITFLTFIYLVRRRATSVPSRASPLVDALLTAGCRRVGQGGPASCALGYPNGAHRCSSCRERACCQRWLSPVSGVLVGALWCTRN